MSKRERERELFSERVGDLESERERKRVGDGGSRSRRGRK